MSYRKTTSLSESSVKECSEHKIQTTDSAVQLVFIDAYQWSCVKLVRHSQNYYLSVSVVRVLQTNRQV